MRKSHSILAAAAMLAALAACNSSEDSPEKAGKKAAAGATEKAKASEDKLVAPVEQGIGTPMKDRVAILGLLNKRNGDTRDIELKPGQDIRIGKVVIRLRACEKTAPWETYPDQGAFVQLIVNERPPKTNEKEIWRQVFSGWLFKENPAANVVKHPIYDVWVKECRMSFPGQEEDAAPEPSSDEGAKKPSSAPQSGSEEEVGERPAEDTAETEA